MRATNAAALCRTIGMPAWIATYVNERQRFGRSSTAARADDHARIASRSPRIIPLSERIRRSMQLCMAVLHFNMGRIAVTNCWRFVISETPDVNRRRISAPRATPADRPRQQKDRTMHLALTSFLPEARIAVSSIDRDIRDFLAGDTDGEELLHALYDHVLDEPVPERLSALLRR